MFIKRKAFVKQDQAGDNGSSGGGTGGSTGFDPNSAEAQAWLQQNVEGLKNKNAELIGKLKQFKADPEQIDKLLALQKQVEANEEMKLLSEGKLDEVLDRRMEAYKRDSEHKYSALDSRAKELESQLNSANEKLKAAVIDGNVQSAFLKLDFEPVAMNDEIRNAREVFGLDEDGSIVPRDSKGNVIYGKDGKSPITIEEWLEAQADKKPYLRRPSSGSGASNARGSSKVDTSKMSSTQKIAEGLKALGL